MTDTTARPEVDDPRVLALAKARQQLAYENPFNAVCPSWDGLSEQEQRLSLLDARSYLHAALKAGLVPAASAAVVPAADRAALRDRIRRAVCEAEGFAWDSDMLEPDEYGDHADMVLTALPELVYQTAEEHRLALSDALGLGTGAPWGAIYDRATELGLPPLDQDPVARRLGLLPAPANPAAALAEDLRYVLGYRGPGHAHEQPGVWDGSGNPCTHCARLAVARRNLAAYDAGRVLPAPADRAAEELAKHVARAIFALKSPTPPGSEHYRAGWDNGLEAAMDAARDAVLRLAAVPVVGVAADTTPAGMLESPRHPARHSEATAASDMCPRCKGDNSEPWSLCAACVPGPVVPAQPGNDTKTPVVAYRSPGGLYLYCTRHSDDVGGSWTPLDSDDLPDGGMCAQCGADVLIPQQPKEA